MKLICALILWQVLLQVSKEDTIPAESHRIDKHIEEIENNNNKTKILEEKVKGLERELESKNKEIKDLEEIETELRRELESKYDPVGKCLMPTVRGELNRQHRIMENLENKLSEKHKNEMYQLFTIIHSKSENLENCEKKLERQKNTLEKKLKSQKNTIDQLESGVKEFVSQLPEQIPKNCIESLSSGPQYIVLTTGYTLKVLCNSDIAGPGWTVILQRIDGKVHFYRDWSSYRDGFGDFWDGNFFLGLDKIRRLSDDQPHELYIHMERLNGSTSCARYDEFAIAGEDDQYKLKLDALSARINYDIFMWHHTWKFFTFERKIDSCDSPIYAESSHGVWGDRICGYFELNGEDFPLKVEHLKIIFWDDPSLKKVKIMIRPKVTAN